MRKRGKESSLLILMIQSRHALPIKSLPRSERCCRMHFLSPPFLLSAVQRSLSLRSLAAVEFSFRFTSGLRRRIGGRRDGGRGGTGPGSRAAPMRVDGARFRIEGEGERRSIRFRRCRDRTQETNTKGEETKMLSFSHEGETQKRTMRTICVAGHRHGVTHL